MQPDARPADTGTGCKHSCSGWLITEGLSSRTPTELLQLASLQVSSHSFTRQPSFHYDCLLACLLVCVLLWLLVRA